MAQVFENRMVAHVWANQSQHSGRSNNGQFYFEGAYLYSYGTHFTAGIIMPDGQAVLNDDSYSVTTNRHQSYARQAVRGVAFTYKNFDKLGGDSASPLRMIVSYERGGGKMPRDVAARVSKDLIAWLESNALHTSDTACLYLLKLAKVRQPEKKLAAIRAAKVKANRKAEAADEKMRKANAISFGTRLGTSSADHRAFIRDIEETAFRYASARHLSERFVIDAFKGANVRLLEAQKELAATGKHKRALANVKALRAKVAARRAIVLDNLRGAFARTKARASLATFRRALARLYVDNPTTARLNDVGNTARALATAPRIGEALNAKLNTLAEECFKKARALYEEEKRIRLLEAREQIEAWKAGKLSSLNVRDERGNAYIRAVGVKRDESGSIVGGELETSQGATVPLPHAIKAFRFVKACRERGEAFQSNGRTIRVGHFRVDRIEASGDMRAGCHSFAWTEIERLAASLDVLDLAPSAEAVESSH